MSANNVPSQPRAKRHWIRWVFITAMVAGLAYLGVSITLFLQDAQMSLGLNRTPGMGIDALLVNRNEWNPPADSLLRPAQVHVVLRIVEAFDTLDRMNSSTERTRQAIAVIMNEHLFDRKSYTWSRSTVWAALVETPTTHADSVNRSLLQMFGPRLREHQRVFTDTLDAMVLLR